MSDQPRPLPGQPSLRYLKLEARHCPAVGEFGTLHDAQLAIAREHGQPSWTALKELIDSRLAQLGHPALGAAAVGDLPVQRRRRAGLDGSRRRSEPGDEGFDDAKQAS